MFPVTINIILVMVKSTLQWKEFILTVLTRTLREYSTLFLISRSSTRLSESSINRKYMFKFKCHFQLYVRSFKIISNLSMLYSYGIDTNTKLKFSENSNSSVWWWRYVHFDWWSTERFLWLSYLLFYGKLLICWQEIRLLFTS